MMMNVLLGSWLMWGPALPQPSAGALLDAVYARYSTQQEMRADFTQKYEEKLSGQTRLEHGVVWYSGEGRVRWSYLKPQRKEFIFDGKTAYFYEPESAQVTVLDGFAHSQAAHVVAILLGQKNWRGAFALRRCVPKQCSGLQAEGTLLELLPKKNIPGVQRAYLEVDVKQQHIRRVVTEDALGDRMTYALTNVHRVKKLVAERFSFNMPANVNVVRRSVAPVAQSGSK